MTEPRKPEADEMIEVIERLGLNALDNVQAMHKRVTGAGKEPKRNQDYQRANHMLDGLLEALGHLLWIHKHYAAGGAAIGTYPSSDEALKHLHDLKAKRNAERKT